MTASRLEDTSVEAERAGEAGDGGARPGGGHGAPLRDGGGGEPLARGKGCRGGRDFEVDEIVEGAEDPLAETLLAAAEAAEGAFFTGAATCSGLVCFFFQTFFLGVG